MSNAVNIIQVAEHGDIPGGGAWDTYKIFDNELVNGNTNVDSMFHDNRLGMPLGQFRTFGFYVVLTGATPSVEFQLLQSYNDVAANYAVPDIGGSIILVADTNIHQAVVTPTPMAYFRIRAAGGVGNGANVRVNAWIWVQS